jgi:hypothetical protein
VRAVFRPLALLVQTPPPPPPASLSPADVAKDFLAFEVSTMPSDAAPLVDNFTKQHAHDHFGFEVPRTKYERMHKLYTLFVFMSLHGIARFESIGNANVFGFTSVTVLDRASWDTTMLALARTVLRNFRVKREIKEPVSCIYEIFKYCGMKIKEPHRHARPLRRGEKKSLKQDAYVYDALTFAKNKSRARGW